MTRRDDVPVHGSEMVQEVDSDETLAAPVDSEVQDTIASSDSAAADSADEQPFFVISEGEDPLDSGDSQVADAAPADAVAGPSADVAAVVEDTPVAETAETESATSAEDPSSNIPEDLRELNDLLDRPTAEIMPITDEAAAAAMVASEGGEPVAAESTSADADTASDAEASAEGDTASDAEASAEGDPTATFDEIAPGTVAGADAAAESAESAEAPALDPEKKLKTVSWWPFLAYVGVWLAAAGTAAYMLQQLPAGQVAYESELYTYVTFGGVGLLAAGPVLLLIVWLVSWLRTEGAKVGSMFISALVKGCSATFFGAALWLGLLLLVDYLRLGRPF
jgi:hypothetical protein